MKHSAFILSLAALCAGSSLTAGGFGTASLTSKKQGDYNFSLTVENKTKDTANVVAKYGSTTKTIGNVAVSEKKTFSISKDKLQAVTITAGSTTETITSFKESKTITIIKK